MSMRENFTPEASQEVVPEIDWISNSERFLQKIDARRDTLPEDAEEHLILNGMEAQIKELFALYHKKNLSLTQVLEDLQYKMSQTKESEPEQYEVYKSIWELTDGRGLKI